MYIGTHSLTYMYRHTCRHSLTFTHEQSIHTVYRQVYLYYTITLTVKGRAMGQRITETGESEVVSVNVRKPLFPGLTVRVS